MTKEELQGIIARIVYDGLPLHCNGCDGWNCEDKDRDDDNRTFSDETAQKIVAMLKDRGIFVSS